MRSISDCVSCRSASCIKMLRVSCNKIISNYSGRMREELVLSGYNVSHSSVAVVKNALRTHIAFEPLL